MFFGKLNEICASQAAEIADGVLVGDGNVVIRNVATLEKATSGCLTFFSNPKYLNMLDKTRADVIVVSQEYSNVRVSGTLIVCKNAMIGYAKILQKLYPEVIDEVFIDDTACISQSVVVPKSCSIGRFACIQDGVILGENVKIGAHSIIYNNVHIGANTVVGDSVSLSHSYVGNNCNIHCGARIGQSGFGILNSGIDKGILPIKQLGRVIIGDYVRIGANTTIDRGSIDDTVIGDCTIIDNLVQIGHNVKIGRNCVIVSQVGIAGSTEIGDMVTIGGQVGIAGHIKIGNRVMVAAKSGISNNISDGSIVGGIPAMEIGAWRRQVATLRRLIRQK